MRRHEIRNQILILAQLPIHPLVFPDKLTVYGILRLPHSLKDSIRDMFWRYFKLPADMVFTQFPKKSPAFVCQKIIKPDSGTDKNLFHLG